MSAATSKFKSIKLKEEEILYREGDVSHSMYLVKTGVISVYSQSRGKHFELVRIQAGQLIGELAFFNPSPRTSFAKALVETELIEIPFGEVQKDFEKFPVWVKVLLNTMSSQVIKFSRELKQFRVADENEPEALNAMILRYLSTIFQASLLYGKPSAAGSATLKIDKSSLKQVTTYLSQLSPHRVQLICKALGDLPGFKFEERGEEFNLTIENIKSFESIVKTLTYYVSTHPHLLFPSTEDLEFLTALKKVSQSLVPGHRGAVTCSSLPVAAELKSMGSKANITLVDSLAQQGLPIQKQSGADGVDLVFTKDDIVDLTYVWEVLNGVLKQNPFKNSAGT